MVCCINIPSCDERNQKSLLKQIRILSEVGKECYAYLDLAINFLLKNLEEYLADGNNKRSALRDIFFYKAVKLNGKRVQLQKNGNGNYHMI